MNEKKGGGGRRFAQKYKCMENSVYFFGRRGVYISNGFKIMVVKHEWFEGVIALMAMMFCTVCTLHSAFTRTRSYTCTHRGTKGPHDTYQGRKRHLPLVMTKKEGMGGPMSKGQNGIGAVSATFIFVIVLDSRSIRAHTQDPWRSR